MDGKKGGQVLDGRDIEKLVENKEVFTKFVDDKFKLLDRDNDGKLSVKELQPAVADIGIALGLPKQGSSPDSDHIYSQVLNEFTHGKEEKVSKTEFKEVLSDILLGMAAGLKRDPIVILRIDGEELQEYISTPSFETDALSMFSEVESPDGTLRDHTIKALQKLGVDQGFPPASDPWVMSSVVEPAVESCVECTNDQKPVTQEAFLVALKKVLEKIVERLREQPVIVAHTENTYDGSAIKNLLANKFETDKVLNAAMQTIPRDKHGRMSKEFLRLTLDSLGPSAGLPPYGAIEEMDKVVNDVIKMVGANDGKLVKEEEFKKLMLEILGSIMLQLEVRRERKETSMAAPKNEPQLLSDNKPISNILIFIAMHTEALPLVTRFHLTHSDDSLFPKGVPWVRYHGVYKNLQINIVQPGKDPALGVDSVGTISASLVTYASIQALQPDLIINAGTAGGFKAKGAAIGDVFLGSEVGFHDRRIPIPVFDLYGVGLRQAFSTPNIMKELNLKVGRLSTGDSLDMSPQDEASINANEATVKDMEGAAVAYVADLLKVPVIFVKAVTDIVDGDKPTAEEFLQNLAAVTAALDETVAKVIDFIDGKSLSEL